MDCPECNESGAYYGLRWVHCMNEKCYFYDAHYAGKVRSERHSNAVDKLSAYDNFIILPDDADDT